MTASARIELFGWQAFYRRPVRALVLDALETLGALAPDHTIVSDGPLRPLDRKRLTEEDRLGGPAALLISREASPGWHALLSLDDHAWMNVEIPAATLSATGARVWFDLGDALVRALEPDAAFVHVRDNPLDAAIPSGPDYYDRGLGGLAMRTYLGQRPLRRVPESSLAALRALASVADCGKCLRIDLVREPWNASEDVLLTRHARAWDTLRAVPFSAEDLGGVARESVFGMRLDREARGNGGDEQPDPSVLFTAIRERRKVVDVYLSWADLRAADLTGLEADGLDLEWAQLEDARVTRGRICGASTFSSANLDRAVFDEAAIEYTSFARAIAPDLKMRSAELEACTFDEAVLTSADFSGARLVDCKFLDACCEGISFRGATLRRVDFAGADLRGADFANATLDDVSFEGAIRE